MVKRIFHGPVNNGGLGGILANWEREHGIESDFICFTENPLMQNCHETLDLYSHSYFKRLIIKFRLFFKCMKKYDLFHFYAGSSFFRTNLDLPILKLFRKKILMTYVGSDIRLVKKEKEINEYTHLLNIKNDDPKFDNLKIMRMYWQKLWVDKVIAPRNLYYSARVVYPKNKIVRDIWIHNVMDMKKYIPQKFETSHIPTIVHAPSEPKIKGTIYIEQALKKLQQMKIEFKYKKLSGVHRSEVLRFLQHEADIVIDQLLVGDFGTLAVESMYFGKPVICYLSGSYKDDYHTDCPIVNASIDNLYDVLKNLIENKSERIEIGAKGRRYVEKYFDIDKVGRQLLAVYNEL